MGCAVGCDDVGCTVGAADGRLLGLADGCSVGIDVGRDEDGWAVGIDEGQLVG